MTNSRSSDERDIGPGPQQEPSTGIPRWVKVSGIVAGAVLLLIVILMLVSGGQHGPGRHGSAVLFPDQPSGATGRDTSTPDGGDQLWR